MKTYTIEITEGMSDMLQAMTNSLHANPLVFAAFLVHLQKKGLTNDAEQFANIIHTKRHEMNWCKDTECTYPN